MKDNFRPHEGVFEINNNLNKNSMVKSLPHMYMGENIIKHTSIYGEQFNSILEVVRELKGSHINPLDPSVTGALLNQVGNNWGVDRITNEDDEIYRYRIWDSISLSRMSGSTREMEESLLASGILPQGKYFLWELNNIGDLIDSMDEFCAYWVLQYDGSLSSDLPRAREFIKNSKVAGVGLIDMLLSQCIVDDTGANTWAIFSRIEHNKIHNKLTNSNFQVDRDAHCTSISKFSPVNIVIESIDSPGEFFKVQIKPNGKLYIGERQANISPVSPATPTTGPQQNNTFFYDINNPNKFYKMWAKNKRNIIWTEETL